MSASEPAPEDVAIPLEWRRHALPSATPEERFLRLESLGDLVFLDSAGPTANAGFSWIGVRGRPITSWVAGEEGDPLEDLAAHLRRYRALPVERWPFGAGVIALVGYEARHLVEKLPGPRPHAGGPPDVWAADFRLGIAMPPAGGEAELLRLVEPGGAHEEELDALEGEILARLDVPVEEAAAIPPTEAPRVSVARPSRERHLEMVERVREHIAAGDVYQVNLGQEFRSARPEDLLAFYRHLRRVNPGSFGAFLRIGEEAVLSVSPERFVAVRDGVATTRPIKGTAPRDHDPVRDRALAEELRASEKDGAELAMIVDVLRNDFSRVCEAGSVSVPVPVTLETHPTVHHLVAEVRGELPVGEHRVELLRATIPGGSITGAPRIRAMELIEDLEDFRRGPWCGNLGWFGYDGAMDTNILIRTLSTRGDELVFPGGGGIVFDSEPELECEEIEHKLEGILAALEGPMP